MERYVLLGLAPARTEWFRSVGQWCHDGSLGAEFIKCVSAEELRARLTSARVHSAILIDAGVPGLDRDLLDTVQATGSTVVVVRDPRSRTDWLALGAHALLSAGFARGELIDVLRAHARPVADTAVLPADEPVWAHPSAAPVIAVCGPGGAGSTTLACCLAQGLASDGRSVVLADLCLRADLAMLHDAGDVGPGVQELVEAHRSGRPVTAQVRGATYLVQARGYHVLLGLRRSKAWASLRPRSFEAAFDGLRSAFDVVVCDTDVDLEGEVDGGSADVEDRNVMARTAVARADVVFVVGAPGLKGAHSLLRAMADVRSLVDDPTRVIPVVNRAPRSGRARSALASALAVLTPDRDGIAASPMFVPERRVEESFVDGSLLPLAIADVMAATTKAMLGRLPVASTQGEPTEIVPGSLATWAETAG